ncbi:MAG: MoaD/ThiS family protein [bacterium]|nr:MoaD/ThiS family protein [bacterium]MDE0288688.1 MoaD/ThiS family protein [bacterium]MDE0439620.1 MoaD/ThiS family protein [bacterium]
MARVRLFANLREIAGASQVDIAGDTVGDVVSALVARYGREFERRLDTARIWKNGSEGAHDDPVTDGDELALIPPVSGGAERGIAGGGLESLLLAGLTLLLLGANVLGIAFLVALWVGVAALWVIDLASASSEGDFKIDYQPLLAAIVVSVATSNTFGLSGLGIGVALTVVIVMGWTIVSPAARDLTTIAASALCALIASLSVSSILLARASVSGAGEGNIAGLLIVAILGAIAGRLAQRSRARIADPYMMASVVMVLAALAVAYLADFSRLGWFFIGLVMAGAVIAGRGIGSAFRTGRIQLTVRPDGLLTALDGPMLAVAVFVPVMWLIL